MASVTATNGSATTTTTVTASYTRDGSKISVALRWSVSGYGYSCNGKVAGTTVASATSGGSAFVNLNKSGTKTVETDDPAAVTLSYPFSAYAQAQKGGSGSTQSNTVRISVPAAQFTLSLDASGGAVDPATKTVTYGETYGELPVPTRSGYAFSGWFTQPEGGEQIQADSVVAITADATLYAQWTLDSFSGLYISRDGAAAPVREVYAVRDGVPARLIRGYLVRDGAVNSI